MFSVSRFGLSFSSSTASGAGLSRSLRFAAGALVISAASSFAGTVPLIESGSEWKYLDTGANLGSSEIVVGHGSYNTSHWKHPDYNDSSWKTGYAPLGYGDPTTTVMSFGPNAAAKYITYYLRKEFTVADKNAFTLLDLGLRRDDGAIVYLNGREIWRENMPAGIVTNTTGAANVAGGADETQFFRGTGPVSALVNGRNVIAIELHQDNATSSDVVVDFTMTGSDAPPNAGVISPPGWTDFEWPITNDPALSHRRLFQDPPDDQIEWAVNDNNISAAGFIGAISYNWVEDDFFPNLEQQLVFWNLGSQGLFLTERVDVRNYHDIMMSIDVRTYQSSTGFEANDRIQLNAIYSTDGISGQKVEFFNQTGGATSLTTQYTVVAPEAAEKQVKVLASAGDLPPNWMDVGFDASAWQSGTGGAGFEASASAGNDSFDPYIDIDLRSTMWIKATTALVRIPFSFSGNSVTMDSLQLRLRYDDGFVAYLNGTEVARSLVPDGPVAWNATSTGIRLDSECQALTAFDITQHKNLLVQGAGNVLAIHAVNDHIGSSDFLISADLRSGRQVSQPGTLDALNSGDPHGGWTTITTPEGLIPDSAQWVQFEIAGSNDSASEGFFFDNLTISATPLFSDKYDNWIALETTLSGTDADPFSDPDFDGIPNVIEYALGSDPEVAAHIALVGGVEHPLLPQFEIDEQGFLRVTYRQLAGLPDIDLDDDGILVRDLRYIVQQSLDGKTWTDALTGAEFLELDGDFVDNDDGTVTVKMRSLEPVDAENEQTRLYRLKIQLLPIPTSGLADIPFA